MRIALTGGIGSGKSTVARLLADHGAMIVDADAIAREVVAPGQPALDEIAAAFGPDVVAPDGTLDRARLASIVFGDDEALARLNAITHPRIAERSAELLAQAPEDAVVVYDMPLLVEQGPSAVQGWDLVIVVDSSDDIRLERLVARGMEPQDARRRMDAQASRAERSAVADIVLDNSGSHEGLEAQVDLLWAQVTAPGT
ncbi:MAG: dephospho-CoA kinase [Candidatus Nanopelagicales bacterium]